MTTFFSLAFLAASVSGKSIALFILISAGQARITIWGLNSMTDWRKAFQITWGTSGEPVGILWGTGGEPGTFCGEPGFWGSLGPWVFVHLGVKTPDRLFLFIKLEGDMRGSEAVGSSVALGGSLCISF